MPKVQRSPPSTPSTPSTAHNQSDGNARDGAQPMSFVNTDPRKPPGCTKGELSTVLAAIESLRFDMNGRFNTQQTQFEEFKNTLVQVRGDVADLNKKFATMRNDLEEKSKSIEFLSGCQDDQVVINTDLKAKIKKLETENSSLLGSMSDLNQKVAQMEQQARDCNIEIQCIPESKSENLLDIMNNLLRSVSCELLNTSIITVHRVAKLKSDSDRPRSVIVKLATPQVRDTVLAAVMTFNKSKKLVENKLNASHLGFTDNKQPIYVLEHLTPANKKLHAAARKTAKEKSYDYVWIRNGRVFIRKNNETPIILVKNEATLNALT